MQLVDNHPLLNLLDNYSSKLQGIPNVISYMDDIVVRNPNIQEHLKKEVGIKYFKRCMAQT